MTDQLDFDAWLAGEMDEHLTQDDRDELNKVPLLGDIPILGHLFRNKSRVSTKTELLVFITPKIVTDRSAIR